MVSDEVVLFLFTLALTAVIIQSLVRYAQTPVTGTPSLLRRLVVNGGGLICLLFVIECVRLLVALLT